MAKSNITKRKVKAFALIVDDESFWRLFNPWDGHKVFESQAEASAYRQKLIEPENVYVVACTISFTVPKRGGRK